MHRAERIRRPVLFGDQGRERVAYEIDAVHDEFGIVLEVEAGRGARGNAVYRDLVRSSLIVDQRFLVPGVMRSYRRKAAVARSSCPATVIPRISWTILTDFLTENDGFSRAQRRTGHHVIVTVVYFSL